VLVAAAASPYRQCATLRNAASRRIECAIARLRDAAVALGRGDPVQVTGSGIAEIEATSEALVAAAARRAQGERERESLLDAERTARATAEQAERRLQLLVAASSTLSNSLEEASALTTIATSIVPESPTSAPRRLLNADGGARGGEIAPPRPRADVAITSWSRSVLQPMCEHSHGRRDQRDRRASTTPRSPDPDPGSRVRSRRRLRRRHAAGRARSRSAR
jgi:hypothetical protein